MLDVKIQGGMVVDGTGERPFRGDVGIQDGLVVAVGESVGAAKHVISADGCHVTPGWIDIHTHYDGLAVWDSTLAPSVWHGCTTALLGNCGVGFAPARPQDRDYLVDLMAGVEAIPADSLRAGLSWDWESFPDYLDVLASQPRTMDIGVMLTHAATRLNVMGGRAVQGVPDHQDLKQMAGLVEAGMRAGALGFSTSRTPNHVSTNGDVVPGTYAPYEELVTIARAIRSSGRGVLEVAPAGVTGEILDGLTREIEMLQRLVAETGCPTTFLLLQSLSAPTEYKHVLDRCAEIQKSGLSLRPQITCKPVNILFTLFGDHPFKDLPAYNHLLGLPKAELIAALNASELRGPLISQLKEKGIYGTSTNDMWVNVYQLGSPLNYFPERSAPSIADLAAQRGMDPAELFLDCLLADGGNNFLAWFVTNWANKDDNAIFEQLSHSGSLLGLGDAGAHVTGVCDAGFATIGLKHWVCDRDIDDPKRISLEGFVRKLTYDNAQFFGLTDRGTLRPGQKADINVIDLNALAVSDPQMVFDLPLGNPRLEQKADGYRCTIVSGELITSNGELTGQLPGRLIRPT